MTTINKNFFIAPSTTGQGAMRWVATLLLTLMLTATTGWAAEVLRGGTESAPVAITTTAEIIATKYGTYVGYFVVNENTTITHQVRVGYSSNSNIYISIPTGKTLTVEVTGSDPGLRYWIESCALHVYGGGTLVVSNGIETYGGTCDMHNITINGAHYDDDGYLDGSIHTVTFNSKGGTAVASQTFGLKYGQTIATVTEPTAPTRTNYDFGGWYKESSCTNAWDFASDGVTADVTLYAKWTPDPAQFSQDGDTYTIHSATGWNVFCDLLAENDKGYFSGKTVLLGADITVTRMAGGSSHDFTGTFDGQGHTLTLNYTTTEEKAAPFRNVESGCVIQNLHVAGTIQTSAKYAAGLVGTQYGAVTIRNCRSSVTVNSTVSGDGTHGGLVALNGNGNGSNLTIEGCVFDGSLLGALTNSCSGFVGYKSNDRTVSITNSLFAPTDVTISETSSATFARNLTMPADANSYYTDALGTAQGTAAYVYTPTSEGFVPANVGAAGTAYSVSGITAYANGLERDGKFYLVKAAVSLADNADNSGSIVNDQVADVTLAGRTLYKDGKWNTLCLPFDVDLTATDCPLYGATARSLTAASVSGTTLNLTFGDAVNTLEAGTPYIIKWDGDGTSNIENPVFEGVTIEATKHDYDTNVESVTTDERVRFCGTYKSTAFGSEDKSILLMGEENTLYYPTTGAGIGAQRAYFKIGDEGALLARRLTSFSIDFGEGEEEATGIINVSAETSNNADGWYSLDGRKLVGKPTQNGIYINNGKKVVIK